MALLVILDLHAICSIRNLTGHDKDKKWDAHTHLLFIKFLLQHFNCENDRNGVNCNLLMRYILQANNMPSSLSFAFSSVSSAFFSVSFLIFASLSWKSQPPLIFSIISLLYFEVFTLGCLSHHFSKQLQRYNSSYLVFILREEVATDILCTVVK